MVQGRRGTRRVMLAMEKHGTRCLDVTPLPLHRWDAPQPDEDGTRAFGNARPVSK
jgi:hypothetical protein